MHKLSIIPDVNHILHNKLNDVRAQFAKTNGWFFKASSEAEALDLLGAMVQETVAMAGKEFPELVAGKRVKIEPISTAEVNSPLQLVVYIPCS